MALPKIVHPLFKLTLPSSGKTVSYRPYTVQEEKLLLIVRMSDDVNEVADTLRQIVNNCVVDEIDVPNLPMFDIEYIFINLRKVSVSNVVQLFFNDTTVGPDGKESVKRIPFTVDLEQVKVKFYPDHTDKIQLTSNVGVKMRYPGLSDMLKIEYELRMNGFDAVNADNTIFDMIKNSIEYVYDDEKVYNDFTPEEIEEFLLSLSMEDLKKIQQFFTTIPALEHEIDVTLPSGNTEKVVLRGIKDFFTF
jgi:hypothetical protein